MSLAIATYVPEGIVMASDSRESVTIAGKKPDGSDFRVETINSDAVMKTFLLEKQQVGISTFGASQLAGIPIASHIKKFIDEEIREKDDAKEVAEKIVNYFKGDFPDTDVGFHVAGYRKEDKVSVPYVYSCHIGRGEVARRNLKPDGTVAYGATWSGQHDVLSVLLKATAVAGPDNQPKPVPIYPIIWDAMHLQDAIDFSRFAIQTTIGAMRFQARPKSVGGPIDVLVITPDETKWIAKKEPTVVE